MKVYLDASVVLRKILKQPGAARNWAAWQWVVTSALTRTEVFRTLDRWRLAGKLTDRELADALSLARELAARFEEVPVDSVVLERASAPFPTRLGTLDAIHLATALLWMEENREVLQFVTHDTELALAARACGLGVTGSTG